jgi:hypothetical protein
MLTEERVIESPIPSHQPVESRPAPVRQEPQLEVSVPYLLWRLVLVGVGFGIAFTGFMLILSVILVFIGLTLFFIGLALMEVGLVGWR